MASNAAPALQLNIEAGSSAAAVSRCLESACRAYGAEVGGGNFAAEPGMDFDLLVQKLKALHGYGSWALEGGTEVG